MAGTSRTFFDFLSQKNPEVVVSDLKKSKSKTQNRNYPIPRDIIHSTWFDIELVQTIFDKKLADVLNGSSNHLTDLPQDQAGTRTIYREGSLCDVAATSIISLVRRALQHKKSQELLGQSLDIVSGGDAIMFFLEGTRFESDYAGTRDIQPRSADGKGRPYTMLPGEAKPSWKCNSPLIEELISREGGGGSSKKFEHFWPFRQLLHYCLGAFARYGYILTDQEVLIVRIRPSDSSWTIIEDDWQCRDWFQDNAIMDYFSVPWGAHGSSSGLTINLALWFLHILAANNGRLSTKPYPSLYDEKIVPLDEQILLGRKSENTESSQDTDKPQQVLEAADPLLETSLVARESQEDDSIHQSFAESFSSQISGIGFKRRRTAEGHVDETWITPSSSQNSSPPSSPQIYGTRSRVSSGLPENSRFGEASTPRTFTQLTDTASSHRNASKRLKRPRVRP